MPGCHADDDDITVSGRVSDHERKAVASAQVRLLDEKGNLIKNVNSYSDGTFSIVHKSCGQCALEVVPDEKSGLATALIDHIAGDQSRKYFVELHKGFSVSGRVTRGDKGLRGLILKIASADAADSHVHGGGLAKTGKDGRFHVTLTSGTKQLTVINDKYPDMVANQTMTFVVSSDEELPDIVLAPK